MVSVECVKHRHAKFGGGFVFCHVMLLIILKPSCSNAIPIEYILCNVPDIQIVPFGFSTFLHNLIHFLLNLCFSSTLVPLSESLSHEPLFTETILWAKKNEKKSRHFFNYQKMKEMNDGKQMKDVWTGTLTKPSEKTEGKHPTQKPEYLLEKIVLSSTEEGQVILDPFCGSGTTGVEAVRFGRKFIGIDISEEYLEISRKRLEKAANDK